MLYFIIDNMHTIGDRRKALIPAGLGQLVEGRLMPEEELTTEYIRRHVM